jgi:Flp pilus assembly pilin Flp
MDRAARDREAGQTFAEYALILGGIALVCVIAVLLLGDSIRGLFESTTKPITPGPGQPPPPVLRFPTTLADCRNGGWQSFPQFQNEAECDDFVNRLAP